jgi:chromosome segregation ATPase
MAANDEPTPTTQFPDQIPQTIPELYFWLKTRLDVSLSALRTELKGDLNEVKVDLNQVKVDLARVETELKEDTRARYVDLRKHISKLQISIDIMADKFDAYAEESKFLRKEVRRLEDQIDMPLLT